MLQAIAQLFELLFYLSVPVILATLAFFFNVLLHELGHAIPVLMMTTGKVEAYVGSFGDPTRSFTCRIGRLHLFIKYNPFLWRKGLCKPPSEPLSIQKRILYTAMGPVTSLLLAITCWYLLARSEFYGQLIFLLFVMLLASAMTTISSIIPRHNAITTASGRKIGNDAAQIRQFLKEKKFNSTWRQMAGYYNNQHYSEAAPLLDKLLTLRAAPAETYRMALFTHIKLKDYAKAARVNEAFESMYDFNADDYSQEAFINIMLMRYTEAILTCKKILNLDPNHLWTLSSIGYALCMTKQDAEAITYLDKALALSPDFAAALDNRGWAQINLGNLEEGLIDLNHSLSLEPSNAEVYRSIGLYHLRKKEPGTAMAFFEKAQAIDPEIPLLDQYMAEAQKELE